MWINPLYLPDDPLALAKQIVDGHPLAVIIAEAPLRVAHLPMLWREDERGDPMLVGHAPLVDPISRALASGERITVVFPGPSAYVTPQWYRSEGLPTYNFVPVHVAGTAERLGEPDLREHLRDLVRHHESRACSEPWDFDATALDRMERLLPRVVGFRIPVREPVVKAKLGQNRTDLDNRIVAERLGAGDADAREVSGLMRRRAGREGEARC
ncbi:MAG: FMN-binding negative transcriptional regulator [Leucobacter sp.]